MTLKISSLLTFSALTAATFFMTTSCKKSNSSSGGGSNSISATISGSGWATTVPTQAIYASNIGEFEILGGSYKGGDTTAVSVAFLTPFPLNKAISSDTAGVDIGYINAKTLAEYDGGQQAGHCIITISSWDQTNHKIAGTFTGVMYNVSGGTDSLVVTNGNFSTAYTNQ
jgi:hypothetical protein